MRKLLFFDNRELETVAGFTRQLEKPKKEDRNPLFISEEPWENGNMQLYGSVVKPDDGPFQLWYSVIQEPWQIYLAYAESDDGLDWRKPRFDIFEYEGEKTNIIFKDNPHGPAVIYDPDDPRKDWRYKMVAGSDPCGAICAYHSPDGIHWSPVSRFPVIGTNPDCPMAFYRARDGRYVVHHRVDGFGRRIFRSESWDFKHFSSEPRMIMEPDAGDPPQIQHYGMGASTYGNYDIGTLWIYHTESKDVGGSKMHGYQEAELTYARSGYAWHRATQGEAFIPHGKEGSWDCGNLQCASAPVFLDHEIRYYYAGTDMYHQPHWELEPQTAGLGLARMKPDRFIGLYAEGDREASLTTVAFAPGSPALFVNASTGKKGWVKVELQDQRGQVLPGFAEDDCRPISGDSISHRVRWSAGGKTIPTNAPLRLRVRAKDARLYSVYTTTIGATPDYTRFEAIWP